MKRVEALLNQTIGCGEIRLKPFIVVEEEKACPLSTEIEINEQMRNAHMISHYECGISDNIFFEFATDHIVCKRRTANDSNKVIKLTETGISLDGIDFGGKQENDYFYHVENPRIYSKMTLPVEYNNKALEARDSGYDAKGANRWADPGVVSDRIGASPYQPFPAILLSNHDTNTGLAHGSLSQKSFFHNYHTGHRDGQLFLDIFSSFKAIKHLEMESGRKLDDIWYLGNSKHADEIDEIFSDFINVLKQYLPPMYGATNINRHSLVWGSWNDGIFRDVDQKRLIENAKFIAANFPTVEWIQIDDGYAQHSDDATIAHGLGMPYEGEGGVAKKKFPDGLKVFSDKVKETGLRPATWMGGHVSKTAKLALEHPEWGVDYNFRIPERMVLDISKPEVREYMLKALDFFFMESGFEGMKLDFWSYAFEDSHDLLENKNRSGYEWRTWWLKEIRKRMPTYGYMQTGCDIVMGNPFLGEHFTNYRYGIDIGGGNWDYVKTNFQWGAACFALQIGDLFVPNSDSVGLFPNLTDEEAFLCINYCLISRSMVELAGWLHLEKDNPRFAILRKTICCPNNGQNVFFADYDYRTNDDAPEIWYLKSPHFSLCENNPNMPLRTVAIFNLGEEEKLFTLDVKSLGLDPGAYSITNVWSNETTIAKDELRLQLKPHASALLSVNACDDRPQLLDADLKVDLLSVEGDTMKIKFGFTGEFTLALSKKPVDVKGASNIDIESVAGSFILSGEMRMIDSDLILRF